MDHVSQSLSSINIHLIGKKIKTITDYLSSENLCTMYLNNHARHNTILCGKFILLKSI